jgi:hypothetical protein
MYENASLSEIISDLGHHAVVARKAYEHGHLSTAQHLVDAGADILGVAVARIATTSRQAELASAPEHNHAIPTPWSTACNFYIADCPACSYYYELGQKGQRHLELNIPESADWSREQSDRDASRRERAARDEP